MLSKNACFIQGALASTNPILRCAAGEALGRMSQVVGESKFVAEMAQYSFDRCADFFYKIKLCDLNYLVCGTES